MGKNLAAEKNRLHNLLLKSLADFHSGISVEAKLREYIHQVEVLFDKGLFSQGAKIIKKAKKISIEKHKHLYSLELQRWEKRLISINQYQSDVENRTDVLYKEALNWTNKYKTFIGIERIYHKVLGFQQIHGTVRKRNEIIKLKKMVDSIRRKTKENDLDNTQKIYYYIMLSVYYRLAEDYEKSYQYQYKQHSLYKEKPADNTELYNYLSYLNNLSLAQIELHKYEEALTTIHKIRQAGSVSFSKKSSRVQNLIFLSYLNEICIYSFTCDFEKGMLVMRSIQKEFEKYSSTIGTAFTFTFWYFFAIICFGAGEYKKAMTWLHKIINHPEQNIRVDLQCFARILGLIVHYELRNEMLLPYYVKFVYRYLLKKNRLFKLEIFIMEFIRKKIPKIHSQKDLKTAFTELKEQLRPLKKDKHEKIAVDDFDFISWLESKIEKRPFAEVAKENAKKRLANQ